MRDAALKGAGVSTTLAVGFFDGVHLGHQKILRGASSVLTFSNHPLSLLAPERAPRLIMAPEDRVQAIRASGVGDVKLLPFTRELAEMSPAEFVETFLDGRFSSVRCGANWRFGKGGAGDADYLRQRGFTVETVPYAEFKGERISSSRIRGCLERAEIEDANAMLGRRYEVRGQRSEGKGLGTKLGFPTINLRPVSTCSPFPVSCSPLIPRGVYEVEMNGEKGIANYGQAPTTGDQAWTEPVLEVHLLRSPTSSDHRPVESAAVVEIVRFIRPERKFASLEELKRQIAADRTTVVEGRIWRTSISSSVMRPTARPVPPRRSTPCA